MSIERWQEVRLYTLGHSTRTFAELLTLIQTFRIAILADIRTIPRSRRNPQFERETLASALQEERMRDVFVARDAHVRPDNCHCRSHKEQQRVVEDERGDFRTAGRHFLSGSLSVTRRMAASRARRNESKSRARPISNGTWPTSPTSRKKRTPTSQVTRTMSADLKSLLPPAQPTARETAGVGYALEVR